MSARARPSASDASSRALGTAACPVRESATSPSRSGQEPPGARLRAGHSRQHSSASVSILCHDVCDECGDVRLSRIPRVSPVIMLSLERMTVHTDHILVTSSKPVCPMGMAILRSCHEGGWRAGPAASLCVSYRFGLSTPALIGAQDRPAGAAHLPCPAADWREAIRPRIWPGHTRIFRLGPLLAPARREPLSYARNLPVGHPEEPSSSSAPCAGSDGFPPITACPDEALGPPTPT